MTKYTRVEPTKFRRLEFGEAKQLAQLQFEQHLTDEEMLDLYGVSRDSLRSARIQHNIENPFRQKRNGAAIAAAKACINSDLTVSDAAKAYGVNFYSIFRAARKMGVELKHQSENRNLMRAKDCFYYRVRGKRFKAFWYLGKDINQARLMRDKLEQFFKSEKR